MLKDSEVNKFNELPGADFYLLEEYLRTHLHPALKSFQGVQDAAKKSQIINMLKFLEILGSLMQISTHSSHDEKNINDYSVGNLIKVQKMNKGYKIFIDRGTVPANPEFVRKWNSLGNMVTLEVSGEIMVKLFGIPNCDKIRKARKLLENAGLSYEFVNVREQKTDELTIRKWFDQLGVQVVVNKRSATYRQLSEDQKKLSNEKSLVEVIQQYPTLIQRPLFEINDSVQIGLSQLKNTIEEIL